LDIFEPNNVTKYTASDFNTGLTPPGNSYKSAKNGVFRVKFDDLEGWTHWLGNIMVSKVGHQKRTACSFEDFGNGDYLEVTWSRRGILSPLCCFKNEMEIDIGMFREFTKKDKAARESAYIGLAYSSGSVRGYSVLAADVKGSKNFWGNSDPHKLFREKIKLCKSQTLRLKPLRDYRIPSVTKVRVNIVLYHDCKTEIKIVKKKGFKIDGLRLGDTDGREPYTSNELAKVTINNLVPEKPFTHLTEADLSFGDLEKVLNRSLGLTGWMAELKSRNIEIQRPKKWFSFLRKTDDEFMKLTSVTTGDKKARITLHTDKKDQVTGKPEDKVRIRFQKFRVSYSADLPGW